MMNDSCIVELKLLLRLLLIVLDMSMLYNTVFPLDIAYTDKTTRNSFIWWGWLVDQTWNTKTILLCLSMRHVGEYFVPKE